MLKTHGLTHINLEVADPDRSLLFYQSVFGVREYFRDDNSIQVLGPGEKDVLAFVKSDRAGTEGGISHFGFRLTRPEDIERAVTEVKQAGGTIKSQGEFAPGCPFVYALDPDGYEIEIWYE